MPRISLRQPSPDDMAAFLALTRRSAAFHAPWVYPPIDAAAYRQYLKGLDGIRKLGFFICRCGDVEPLGLINVSEIVRGAFQSAFLGYWIGAPFARRGYMRAGLKAVIAHCFSEIRLHRLEANIQPENGASKDLVRGLGFRREGYSPQYLFMDGEWRDHERWALRNPDWRSVP